MVIDSHFVIYLVCRSLRLRLIYLFLCGCLSSGIREMGSSADGLSRYMYWGFRYVRDETINHEVEAYLRMTFTALCVSDSIRVLVK